MLAKFLDPKNDIAFKQIFGSEKNKDILIHFINDVVDFGGDTKIETVKFLKPNMDPDILSKKQSILDVLCADQKGRQYIVEMQVARSKGFEQRAQYYAAKAYSNQLNAGEKYDQLKEIIFIAITDFVMFPDKKSYKSDHVVLDKITLTRDLEDFSFTFIELPKFNKKINELSNIVEKWVFFFKHAPDTHEDDVIKIVGKDDIIERAYQVLNACSWTDNQMHAYDAEIKRLRDEAAVLEQKLDDAMAKGRAEGHAAGHVQGIADEKHKIAKQMLTNGIDIALIIECTGLTTEEIKQL